MPPGANAVIRTSSFLKSVGLTTTRTPFASVHSVTPSSGIVRVETTAPGAGDAAISGALGAASAYGLMSRAATSFMVATSAASVGFVIVAGPVTVTTRLPVPSD